MMCGGGQIVNVKEIATTSFSRNDGSREYKRMRVARNGYTFRALVLGSQENTDVRTIEC